MRLYQGWWRVGLRTRRRKEEEDQAYWDYSERIKTRIRTKEKTNEKKISERILFLFFSKKSFLTEKSQIAAR